MENEAAEAAKLEPGCHDVGELSPVTVNSRGAGDPGESAGNGDSGRYVPFISLSLRGEKRGKVRGSFLDFGFFW